MIKKAGLSKADSAKALAALKSGKVNMGQLASKLNMSTLPTITDPRERLKAKLRQQRGDRQSKEVKEADYEKMRERVHKEKAERELAAAEAVKKAAEAVKKAAEAVKKAAAKRKNHTKKLKELEAKYGTITDETYQKSMRELTNAASEEETNRLKNIIEIYARQNKFKDTID